MKKKSLIHSLAIAIALCTASAVAQQAMMDGMKGMDMPAKPANTMRTTYQARGVVKQIDAKAQAVTIAHGPVASLHWPAMAMSFGVNDKLLLKKLAVGKTIDFEFTQADKGYTLTGVK